MGAKVIFEVDAKHAPAMAKFLEFRRVVDDTAKSFEKAFKTTEAGADKAAGGVGQLAGQLGKLALGITGFGTALGGAYTVVRLIGAEYERMKQMQLSADERKRAALPAFNQAKLNAGGFNLESAASQKIINRIIQSRGSANAADSFDLIAHMMSGRGSVWQNEVLSAALEVARYAGQRQLDNEGAKFLGGAVMDQANTDLAKGRTPNYKATLGKFEKGFGVSRSTSIQDFATHDMRAIVGLQRHYNVSESEAIGLQGAITEAMPDLHGRRGATENMLLFENLHQAFNELHARRIIKSMSPEQFMALPAQQRIAWASGNTKEAKWMRAHLFGVNTPDVDMRRMFAGGGIPGLGISEQGSLQGEAGGKEVARNIFTPGNPIVRQWQKNIGEVFTDPAEAAAYYERQMAERSGPGSLYSSNIAAQQGLQAATDWANSKQASAGAAQRLAEDMQLKTGRGALESRVMDAMRTWNLRDPSQASGESRLIAEQAIDTIYNRRMERLGYDDAGVAAWRQSHGLPAPRLRESKSQRLKFFKQYADETGGLLDDEEQTQVEALRSYIEQIRANQRGAAGGAAPSPTDQSNRQIQLLERIAERLDNGQQMNVQVEDVGGRMLGRQSSFAKPLEQLHDAPITG